MLPSSLQPALRDRRGLLRGWGFCVVAVSLILGGTAGVLIKIPAVLSLLTNLCPILYGNGGDSAGISLCWLYLTWLGTLLPSVLALFLIHQGSRLLGGEAERQNLSLLASYPLPRWKILAFGVLFLGILALILALISVFGTGLGMVLAGMEPPLSYWIGYFINLFLFGMFFGLAAMLAADWFGNRRAGRLAGWGLLGAAFLFFLIPKIFQAVPWLAFASPLTYLVGFDPINYSFPWKESLILLFADMMIGFAAWRSFEMVDLE